MHWVYMCNGNEWLALAHSSIGSSNQMMGYNSVDITEYADH